MSRLLDFLAPFEEVNDLLIVIAGVLLTITYLIHTGFHNAVTSSFDNAVNAVHYLILVLFVFLSAFATVAIARLTVRVVVAFVLLGVVGIATLYPAFRLFCIIARRLLCPCPPRQEKPIPGKQGSGSESCIVKCPHAEPQHENTISSGQTVPAS
ncbi:uncharacterized protein BDZ99DRAFT_524595 [Mytilinidion resinicola]|uniref:Uncharacterized protein n=1 Tax=Mytilinidion resinicola TaxID=574789 RepID=A0A6A6YCS0_9PEZI|nr:uncharacterized protein BDZ99DRAFT_524595 [Mytilinidion resinicola]KAF2805637.1 hypothetical protein BDZ99DRAFT_524595 [Mytilinidion resinicola]